MFARKFVAVFLSLLSSPALVEGAMAREAGGQLEEIVVEGKYLSIDKMNAVKTPTPALDVPQSLSVIPGAQIERQALKSVGDILRYTPGLSISQGEGHRDAIIVRGQRTTADFFIDGVRDDTQYYRPLYNVERVEVLRGPNALLFGRGGGGGVINRVGKQPELDERFAVMGADIDTFAAWTLNADANYAVSDNAGLRLNGYYHARNNHRDFFDGDSFALNPTLKFGLGGAATGLLSYEYVDDDRVVDRGVPSRNIDGGPNEPIEGYDDAFFGSPDMNMATLQAHILRARVDHEFSDLLRGNLALLWADYGKLYQNLYASDAVDAMDDGSFDMVELDGYRDATERENFIVQGNLIGEISAGFMEHTALFGVEYGRQGTKNNRRDNVFAMNMGDKMSIMFTDPLDIPEFAISKQVRDRESAVNFISVYLQDQIDLLDNFKLVLGARYDEFDIDVFDFIEQNDGDAVAGGFGRKDSEATPRLGGIYKPAENMSFYVSYSETFLPASGDQFLALNPDSANTRPQLFKNLEGGVKWDIRPDLSMTAAVFELDRDNYTSPDPNDPAMPRVIGGSEVTGFEAQLSGAIMERWLLIAGYSYLDGEITAPGDSNDGNRNQETPEHMFSLWSHYQVTEKFGVGLGLTYQDKYYIAADNNAIVPDYIRVDAGLYYNVNDSVSVQVNIENLFDADYYPDSHNNNNITTGEPLNARFSMRASF